MEIKLLDVIERENGWEIEVGVMYPNRMAHERVFVRRPTVEDDPLLGSFEVAEKEYLRTLFIDAVRKDPAIRATHMQAAGVVDKTKFPIGDVLISEEIP